MFTVYVGYICSNCDNNSNDGNELLMLMKLMTLLQTQCMKKYQAKFKDDEERRESCLNLHL